MNAPQKLSASSMAEVINWLLLLICLAVLVGSLVMGWKAMEPSHYQSVLSTTDSGASKTAAIPELHLNKEHAREGATIEVDPNDIGKNNPFK